MPTLLFAALLAPAILAGGLLAGELTGYQAPAAPQDRHEEAEGVAFEPVLAPAPPSPDLTYEGSLPAPEREKQRDDEAGDTAQHVVPSLQEEPVVARPSKRPRPAGTECPGEWEDTWLWELCREHERRPV